MAEIIKRGEGKYLVRVFLGKDSAGKRLFKNKTIRGTRADAQKWAREEERRRDLGDVLPESNTRTLAEQIQTWLNLKEPDVSRRTLESYQSVPRLYLGNLAAKRITAIRPDDLTDLYADLRAEGYSSRIIRRVHTVCCAALKLAYQRRQLHFDPTVSVKAPKYQRQVKIQVFTRDEARRFMRAIAGAKHEALFHLALETGLRPEEYLALRWSDLDLERGSLIVRRVLVIFDDGSWEFSEALKTDKARRIVPLSLPLQSKLRSLPREVELVFANRAGGPLNVNNLRKRHFAPILAAAKLPARRLYDLRHSCATLLLDAGVNPKVVSERLGHASVAFTLDTYGHVLPHQQDAATVVFENLCDYSVNAQRHTPQGLAGQRLTLVGKSKKSA
jgi:integrase